MPWTIPTRCSSSNTRDSTTVSVSCRLTEDLSTLAPPAYVVAGTDVTLATYGGSLHKVLAAADELEKRGVSAEVVDLRSLRPLDSATVQESVARTHRIVVVDEGWRSGGINAEIIARVAIEGFFELDAPPGRVCTEEVPIPYPRHLEEAALPRVSEIVREAEAMVAA